LLEVSPDRWWLWRGRVFRVDEAYDARDVLALLVQRERRNQRRLALAKAELGREAAPARRGAIPRYVKLAVWEREGWPLCAMRLVQAAGVRSRDPTRAGRQRLRAQPADPVCRLQPQQGRGHLIRPSAS
jgi:hypothetical protein